MAVDDRALAAEDFFAAVDEVRRLEARVEEQQDQLRTTRAELDRARATLTNRRETLLEEVPELTVHEVYERLDA